MKKLALFIAILLVPLVAQAQVSVTGRSFVRNQYIGVAGGQFWPGSVAQSDISISNSWLNVFLWHSTGLGENSAGMWNDFDDEFDIIVSMTTGILPGGLSMTNGVGYFEIVESAANLDGNVMTAFSSISKEVELNEKTLSPFLRLEAYAPSRGETPGSGLLIYTGVSTVGNLGNVSIWGQVNVVHDSGAFDFESGWQAQQRTTVTVPIFRNVSLEGDFYLSTPITSVNDGRKTFVQYGFGLSNLF